MLKQKWFANKGDLTMNINLKDSSKEKSYSSKEESCSKESCQEDTKEKTKCEDSKSC